MTTPPTSPAEREAARDAARAAVRLAGVCEWFALCTNPATDVEPHPILGSVPVCERCKARAHPAS